MRYAVAVALARVLGPALFALTAACAKEKTGTVAGPGLTVAEAGAPASAPSTSPVTASFVDVGAGASYTLHACEQLTFAVAKGNVTVGGEKLAQGDLLIARGTGSIDMNGAGRIVVASVQPPVCEPIAAKTPITKIVVRASAAPELTWAGGKMHAHLDAVGDVSPNAYVGRLEGSGNVFEHAHPSSWEILCAIEGAGTFTLDGKAQRLEPGQIVRVPPGVKHAWTPDPGTKLVAVQMYAPPGPEQRFKALAAAEVDAGKRP